MMETVRIVDAASLEEYREEVERYFSGPWLSSFPCSTEREDPGSILERVTQEIRGVRTEIWLLIDSGEVLGGLVLDRYTGTEWSELIYICISEVHRGLGYGGCLMEELLRDVSGVIFLECDKEGVGDSVSVIDPSRRLSWYRSLGFGILRFDYIMPPLISGNGFYDGLYLLSSSPVSKGELIDFLERFYYGLSAEGSKELEGMKEGIRNGLLRWA